MAWKSTRAGRIAMAAREQWKRDGLNDMAAGVTFWAVLSVAPAALALAAMLGIVGRIIGADQVEKVRDEITRILQDTAGVTTGAFLDGVIDILDTPSGAVAIVGLVIAVWSMSKAFAALFRGLARIQGHPGARTNLRGRVAAVGFGSATIGVIMMLLLSSVVGPLLGFEQLLPNDGGLVVEIWDWVRVPVLAVAAVAWLAVLLARGPGGGLRWRDALPGAVFTSVGWTVLTLGFDLYVRLSGGGNPVYGVLGGIIVALSWLYLLVVALVLGGLLNALLVQTRDPIDPEGTEVRSQSALSG